MTPAIWTALSFSVATGVVATLAGAGLALASQGRAKLTLLLRLVAAGSGSSCLLLPGALSGSPDFTDPFALLLAAFLGAFLGCLGLLDRMTAWAPDVMTAPAVILAMVGGASSQSWGMGFLASVCTGVAIFGAIQMLWSLFCRSALRMPPPPDIYGLLMPILLFGFSLFSVSSYILLALALVFFQKSQRIRTVFSLQAAMQEAAEDMGLPARPGEVVPLLAILCPVVILVAMIRDVSIYW